MEVLLAYISSKHFKLTNSWLTWSNNIFHLLALVHSNVAQDWKHGNASKDACKGIYKHYKYGISEMTMTTTVVKILAIVNTVINFAYTLPFWWNLTWKQYWSSHPQTNTKHFCWQWIKNVPKYLLFPCFVTGKSYHGSKRNSYWIEILRCSKYPNLRKKHWHCL